VLPKSNKLTAEEVSNVTFRFSHVDENGYRISYGTGTHPVSGLPITVEQREPPAVDELFKLNAEERNSRDGKRWGAGAGSEKGGNVPMIRVARTPLNILFRDVIPRLTDPEHTKWWLQSDGALPFRTKSGKL
jgi:hypothetical protein